MSNKTKTNFISASVKKVLSLSLLVTGGVVMSSMALALLLQDTASSNNEKVQVWGIQSRVQYLTGMTLSWANSDRIKFEYKEDKNALNFNGAMNLHALVIGSTNEGATGSTVIGGNNNVVKWNWQNAAIIGGNKNTVTDTTTSIIAGATGSNITNVQDSAIFSAEGTIIGSDNTTDTMFIVWGKGHVARGRNTNFIAGSENIKTDQNAQNNVLIGKNIRSNQSNIFVWSNGNTELTPQKGSAFYVNSTSGFGLNTNNPQAALDIANGGLAFNKVYQLSEISDVNVAGVHTVVQKDGKQGVCGYNGSTWVPLTLNAEREGLCTASTQSTPPKHATSTISGAVQFSGQPVITNGTTLLHQVWSGGMNNNHGGWLNHPWTYKHTGPLDNGDYRCGIGFHMGNPTPDGMKNTDCKACSPITNQRDWRSNGKNDDCDFSCKAGFKKVGRTCIACEVGTYTTDGTVANSCASCTNKPANAHYTTNGINANACQWACDAGYHNVGWACKKAVWQKTDTYTCNVAGGIWKDDKIVTTYHCALEENRGVSVPEHICSHWWVKPNSTEVKKWDENCNTPQWETNWSCPTPNCNISRIAGKCGGATEAVTCIQHKRDRAWNSYETRTQSQQKACTRTCETALCGGANGVATKYQPTALCAAGTASAVGGNPSVWSWTCTQLDGAKNCSATKIPLQAGSCGYSHNINHNTLNAGSANLCNYGSVISFNENGALYTNRWSWKCRGDNGAHNQDANCIAHKPAPQAGRCAQALNTCMVGTVKDQRNVANGKRWSCQGLHGGSTDTTCSLCDNGYIYDSVSDSCKPKCGAGYTLQDGICVKWDCRTTPPSTGPGRCEGNYRTSSYCISNSEAYGGSSSCNGVSEGDCNRRCRDKNWVTWVCPRRSVNPGEVMPSYDVSSIKVLCRWVIGEQRSCSSLNQTRCGSESWCHRTPWTTIPAATKTVCIDEQWHTRPDADCANAGAKSCVVPVNGQCKIYSWVYISQPATSTANGCVAGEFEDIADDGLHKWKCKGKSWGTDETCSARKRPAPSPLTCPTGFVLNNGKCVQWTCHNRTKPGAHWCIGSAPSSECKKITQESLCENLYEMREICTSIGLPCIGIGPEIFITKERAATFPNWSPVGIGYDPSKWMIGEYYGANWYLGYGWSLKNPAYAAKVGPCQWWEKEQIVVCKNASGTILPDQNCISPKPEEDDVCDPIVPPSSTVPPRPPVPPKKPPVPPLNGQCKTYAWSHASQPATSKVTGCLAGDYEDIPDDSAWKWRCKGKNGGLVAYCSAAKQPAPSGCTPWTTQKCWYDSGEDPCHFTQTCRPDRTRGPCRNPHSWNHDMTCNYRWESVYCGPAAVVDETTRDTCECFDWKTFQWALPWYPWNKDAGWELVRRLNLWNGKSDPCE